MTETSKSEPTTYALPDEPEGPVWDKYGERWTPTDIDGWWQRDVTGVRCSWARVLEGYGPLTSTPPWKPEVGGTVETIEQYAAMPLGSIVVGGSHGDVPWLLRFDTGGDYWCSGGHEATRHRQMAPVPRTILRVGWSL